MKLRKLSLEELPPVLLACAGILGIGPMAAFRLLEGSFVVAAIDLAAAIAFVIIIWSIYVKRAVRTASYAMAVVAITTAVASISIRGGSQLVWLYPALIALFYLLTTREAAVFSVVAIVAVSPVITKLDNTSEMAIYLASLAVTLALSIAFASMNAAQRKALRLTTLRDPLTGTANRRALEQSLESAIINVQKHGQSFAIVMFDIDHFKGVNDGFGHSMGDKVLRHVADVVNARIRPSDTCFRAGGEEFVVLVRPAKLDEARQLAERLRTAIFESSVVDDKLPEPIQITASFGVAEYIEGETLDDLYKRADDALYEAKRNGRNRAHLSERTVSLSGTASYEISPALAQEHKDASETTPLSEAS